jgi:hypothetical protein
MPRANELAKKRAVTCFKVVAAVSFGSAALDVAGCVLPHRLPFIPFRLLRAGVKMAVGVGAMAVAQQIEKNDRAARVFAPNKD